LRKLISIAVTVAALAINLPAGAQVSAPAAPPASASDASTSKAFLGIAVQALTDAIMPRQANPAAGPIVILFQRHPRLHILLRTRI
jgi:hypothetical protein